MEEYSSFSTSSFVEQKKLKCVTGWFLSWGNPSLIGRDGESSKPGLVCVKQENKSSRLIIQSMSVGAAHTAIVLSSGDIYTWGMGLAGRLALGDERKRSKPTKVTKWSECPVQKVDSVSCGMFHTAVVDKKRRLHTVGRGYKGFLGHQKQTNRSTFKLVEALSTVPIRSVACAKNHTIVVAQSGALYTFGFPNYGRLGHGDDHYRRLPKLVEALKDVRIIQADTRGGHSIALSDMGTVYTWGSNKDGRLGLGDETNRNVPTKVKLLDSFNIKKVSSGYTFCAVSTNDGQVLTWGLGTNGQLGVEGYTNSSIPLLVPLKDISDIGCGDNYMMAISDGILYSWGEGTAGQLGTGKTKNECIPCKVDMSHLEKESTKLIVEMISCGSAHSFAIVSREHI